jgi:hypothetical protein
MQLGTCFGRVVRLLGDERIVDRCLYQFFD